MLSKIIRVKYDDILLGDQRVDFMVEDKIIVELKVVAEISEIHFGAVAKHPILQFLQKCALDFIRFFTWRISKNRVSQQRHLQDVLQRTHNLQPIVNYTGEFTED